MILATPLIDELRAIGVPDAAIPSVLIWMEEREEAARGKPRERIRHLPHETRNGVSSLEWRALRTEVFSRDGLVCVYCGSDGDGRSLHADHVQPLSKGGQSSLENLAASCWRCNLSKGGRTREEWARTKCP